MPPAAPGFTPKTLAFLRALKRNNRREWFHERRAEYDQHVHAPMMAIVDQLALDFPQVAPEFVATPKVSMFRPWRDTRFSANKAPLKTNVAAVFPHRALGRMQGAGLYFEVSTESVWIGGGLYSPDSAMLHAVRTHIVEHHRTFAKLVGASKFKTLLGTMQGTTAARMPRGFDAAHPAADVLRHKQFLAAREEAPAFAARPDFYRQLLATFEAMAPFVGFLNQPIVEMRRTMERDPLVAERAATSRRRPG
ncbi:MAG: DUF2461 domain-containing protein [Acidobacteria bacterium]|nr:DUF2461 domain-containing protein [Acidobacteriota bacterium]